MTWKRGLALLSAAALLCACAAPGKHAASALPGQACAELVAKQVTTATLVKGAYDCLDAAYQVRASNRFTDAAGFASFAAGFPFSLDKTCGRFQMQNLSMSDGSTPAHEFVFLVHSPQGDPAALIIVPDADGKVADIGLVAGAATCPKAR